MKFKTLLFAAVAGLALNAAAEDVQGSITAQNITLTQENAGQPFELTFVLGDMGQITGEEDGYWKTEYNEATGQKEFVLDENGNKIENYDYRIGDARMWKNIQFNLTFPVGIRPVKVNADDAYDGVLTLDNTDDGVYDLEGDDVVLKARKPVVNYSNNYDMPEKYPNHIALGSNMTATPNPEGQVYRLFCMADEDLADGEYQMMVYCKWVDQCDGGHTIYTDEVRGVLCTIVVDRVEEPQVKTLAGIVRDSETGEGIADVTVTIAPVTEEPAGMFRAEGNFTTVTDAEGAYSVEVPADAEYTLTFSKEGYETLTVGEADAENVLLVKEEVTGVADVNAAKAVASVKYYNAAGVASDNAFQGINIVVTKYADGSQSIVKIVK